MSGPPAIRAALLIPRFYLAVIFLIAVTPKLKAGGGFARMMAGFLGAESQRSPAWYQAFLHAVVLPHAAVFAALVQTGELLVGLALLTGTLTRWAGAGAIFLNLNYMFAKGATLWSPASNDAADVWLAAIVVLTEPGRFFGVDGWLAERRRHAARPRRR